MAGILNGVEDVVRPDNAVLGLTEVCVCVCVCVCMCVRVCVCVYPKYPMYYYVGSTHILDIL